MSNLTIDEWYDEVFAQKNLDVILQEYYLENENRLIGFYEEWLQDEGNDDNDEAYDRQEQES